MKILQVNTADLGGGAETVATRLQAGFAAAGHDSWLAVGRIRRPEGRAEDVWAIPRYAPWGPWGQAWGGLSRWAGQRIGRMRGAGTLSLWADRLARPPAVLDWWRGREDFRFPGTAGLLGLTPEPPDVVLSHNLHGSYFDLRALPALSRVVPFVVNPHDAWLLSGHCAHSYDCEHWREGCGACPDLGLAPGIRRDATRANWRAKAEIYAASRLYLTVASQWLMDRMQASMLMSGVEDARVIHYGVETRDLFVPAPRAEVRRELGLPGDAVILLAVGAHLRTNRWKDYPTLEKAFRLLTDRPLGRKVLFLGLGDKGETQRFGDVEVRFVPFVADRKAVVRHYQAADVFVHPARVDTAPQAVMEAMACGAPVIASAVAGIPEQVKPWDGTGPEDANGMLCPAADAGAMAGAIEVLVMDDVLRQRLADNARRDAVERFSVERYVDDLLGWFDGILGHWSSAR